MASTASAGLRRLDEHVSGQQLKVKVRFDQAYAEDQHETLWYKHPRGGQAKYLESALFEGHRDYFGDIARRVLRPGGPSLNDAFVEVGRDLTREAGRRAPLLFGDLRRSGALSVYEGTRLVHRDDPQQGRLTEQELEVKWDNRRLLGLDGW